MNPSLSALPPPRVRLHIIAPALPPRMDGIGDYTACLAAELKDSVDLKIWIRTGEVSATLPNVAVEEGFAFDDRSSVSRMLDKIEAERPDWVLLQYNPFSYGRLGLNLHLPRAIARMKRRHPEIRFALMVHEPFVPLTSWKFGVMSVWQRWQLRSLGRSADLIFFSIDSWVHRFQRWFPGKPVFHLPVGSNIPRVPITRAEARARLGITEGTTVLGVFGTFGGTRLLEEIKAAVHSVAGTGRDCMLVYIGPHGKLVREAIGDLPALTEGPLPADEVSRRLAAVDIFLSPFIDGVSTRRGSMMAALQHGLAVVGTRGPLTDRILQQQDQHAMLLAGVGDAEGFAEYASELQRDVELRECLGTRAHKLYEAEFSWKKVVARLLQGLAVPNPDSGAKR